MVCCAKSVFGSGCSFDWGMGTGLGKEVDFRRTWVVGRDEDRKKGKRGVRRAKGRNDGCWGADGGRGWICDGNE